MRSVLGGPSRNQREGAEPGLRAGWHVDGGCLWPEVDLLCLCPRPDCDPAGAVFCVAPEPMALPLFRGGRSAGISGNGRLLELDSLDSLSQSVLSLLESHLPLPVGGDQQLPRYEIPSPIRRSVYYLSLSMVPRPSPI